MFTAPGDTDGTANGLEGGEEPIDDSVWVLALVGLFFVFFKMKSVQNKKIHS